MKLSVVRRWFNDRSTIGELCIDGVLECYTLELPGAGAIAVGTYVATVYDSPRLGRKVLRLRGVPGQPDDLIEIHWGNWAVEHNGKPADTRGCILVGRVRHSDWIDDSKITFDRLMRRVMLAQSQHQPFTVQIEDARAPTEVA